MKSALGAALSVGALTLVFALMLASCGGGGGGGPSAGGGSSHASNASTSGESTNGGTSGGAGKYGSASSAATTATKGASKSASSKSPSGGVLKTIVIKESEFELSPSSVTLSKPGTYAFEAENKGSAEHSLEIDGEGVKAKGGEVGEARLEQNLQPGQSGVLTVTFRKPGTYEMYCPIIGHRLAGMKGSVVVN
jgi:uncharacterized cupredoxin-like copper-binding protein